MVMSLHRFFFCQTLRAREGERLLPPKSRHALRIAQI